MTARPRLILADQQRTAARAQLFARIDQVKARLAPGALADDAMNGIADRATRIAARRPMAFLGAAAAVGFMILRRPVLRWLSRRRT
ncbi:hypothetical protein [Sphingomonas sp.]|uniref:hypothetical protein n=1 Tax=Sphingomonas sp. TaxID=28214 RepID=UPI002C50BE9D|nr:hypothetical protein [Sphingomonas sp.]HWK36312.1 hypothetical protein [Sphingomonas sp.]